MPRLGKVNETRLLRDLHTRRTIFPSSFVVNFNVIFSLHFLLHFHASHWQKHWIRSSCVRCLEFLAIRNENKRFLLHVQIARNRE